MKSSDLHNVWSSPDNSRVTSKQYSFRLPVHVAAKLAALCEMYPHKTRTEIVGDLLSTSIEDVIKSIPVYEGEIVHILPDGEEIRDEIGPRVDFWQLADKHYQALEKEMGNENPPSIFDALKYPLRKDVDE
ncbi:hypothetical protein [Methylophilus methylotrophus]|uniref:hypothetical protein n=1 Tax=Methylophilus methylotrophus TaxID=17 RepID=UPI0012B63200|nr:hypothetical protein [Methylophilus methylotrophus]